MRKRRGEELERARGVLQRFVVWLPTALGLALPANGGHAQEPGGPHLELPQIVERGEVGPHLLLIPCAGCGAASWAAFMEANADRFRMIAITLPGYDGSPRPQLPLWTGETVFQDNAVDQLVGLLDERQLREVVVVGHSFGSLIGLRLAAARPDAVEVLVNVDGSPVNPPLRASNRPDERLAEARSSVDEGWGVRLQDPGEFRRFNAATRQPTAEQRTLHHGMFMASDRVSMLHYWRENLLRDRNPDFRALRASYLDIKALFPWDERPDSTLAAYVQSVSEVGTPAHYRRVVFHDTSHWVHLQRPRALGTVILDHLEGRPVQDVGPFRFGAVVRAGEGPRDVILMPCLGCDASSWDEFMTRNRARYRMVAVTWPGLGETTLPTVVADPEGTPYFDYLVEALDLLIEREGLDRPVLVGHSAAAVLAVRYAAERPHRVSGAVNVDATVTNWNTYGFDREQRRAWADEEMAEVHRRYDEADAWARLNSAPTGMPRERARFYERMWRTPPRANVFAYWRDWLRTDAGALLPALSVPFLAIHALPTESTRAAEKRADLEARYARAPMPAGGRVVLIEASGHTIWEYRPEAFDRVVADFVLGSAVRTVAPS